MSEIKCANNCGRWAGEWDEFCSICTIKLSSSIKEIIVRSDKTDQTQLRKEKEQKFKKDHEIRSLFHICHIDNLCSIIEKGLLSRQSAGVDDCKFVDIANQGITDRRDKPKENPLGLRLTTFASTYFEPINGMYFGVRKPSEPEKIVIVAFKLVLSKEGIVITDGNAAHGESVKTSYDDHSFVKIMSEIDELTINPPYKGEKQWEGNRKLWLDHKRRKAAECLVPKNIRQDCIYAIHIYPDSNVEKQVKSWIVNSGLPIEIILMPKRPTSIHDREDVI